MMEGPRAARVDELPAVVNLANTVFHSDGSVPMGSAFPVLYGAANAQNLRIFGDDGVPVSLVGQVVSDVSTCGARLRTVCIGSVCTLEAYRGRGLAAALMDDAIATAKARGAVLAFISGGRGLYRRMGCVDAGLYTKLTTDRRTRTPRMNVTVRPSAPSDARMLCALQRREPVRFCRSEDETRLVAQSGFLHACKGTTWVVEAGGKVVAWAAALYGERDGKPVMYAREMAGSRAAILAALPALRKAGGRELVDLDVLCSDTEMHALAASLGIKAAPRGFDGTVKIIDVPGFFAVLREWMAERAPGLIVEAGDPVRFSLPGATMSVTGPEDLAALVFGSIERTPPAPPAGPLADALARVFPVPVPTYGLSYV